MLTADQFDTLSNSILDLYAEYELSVMQDIARRLANMDIASAGWQAQRLNESGALYKDIIKKLSSLTGKSEKQIKTILTQAGVKAMAFDDAIYLRAGFKPLPLNLSPAMLNVLRAGLIKTNGVVNNLTKTTAIAAQQAFIHAADLAYMQISTGAMSYEQALRHAVKTAARKGLEVIDYTTGKRDKLDVAMRRAVLTGISQTTGQLQMARSDELGQDLVQVSAHIGARNQGEGPENHESWQGKVYSRSGTSTEYPPFVATTGYGTGAGLGGWNCRHSFYPFFEGISESAYKATELKSYANKTVIYNGEKISVYEATQIQRGIERKLRFWKRQETALKAAGFDATQETAKVKQWQFTMREFIKETGLTRQRARETIITTRNNAIKPIVPNVTYQIIEIPKTTVFRGEDIRNELLNLDLSNENSELSLLGNKQDLLIEKLNQLNLGSSERIEVLKELAQIENKKNELSKKILEKQRQTIYAKSPSNIDVKYTVRDSSVLKRQEEAVDIFNKLKNSNVKIDSVTIEINRTNRSYYWKNVVYVNKYSSIETIIHELGHHLELSNKSIFEKAISFYKRRTKNSILESLKHLTGENYSSDEKTRKDDFMHPYMGKEYLDKNGEILATEIISMGIQYLYADPLAFANGDPDFFDFIIEILAGIS